MQNGKAPGPDDFPVDFYKEFLQQLAPLLLDMFNNSKVHGIFNPSLHFTPS